MFLAFEREDWPVTARIDIMNFFFTVIYAPIVVINFRPKLLGCRPFYSHCDKTQVEFKKIILVDILVSFEFRAKNT